MFINAHSDAAGVMKRRALSVCVCVCVHRENDNSTRLWKIIALFTLILRTEALPFMLIRWLYDGYRAHAGEIILQCMWYLVGDQIDPRHHNDLLTDDFKEVRSYSVKYWYALRSRRPPKCRAVCTLHAISASAMSTLCPCILFSFNVSEFEICMYCLKMKWLLWF